PAGRTLSPYTTLFRSRHAGGLAQVRPDDLLGQVIKALVERNPFALEAYEDVIAGCTNQAGEDARNVARHAGLLAGLPFTVGGQTDRKSTRLNSSHVKI